MSGPFASRKEGSIICDRTALGEREIESVWIYPCAKPRGDTATQKSPQSYRIFAALKKRTAEFRRLHEFPCSCRKNSLLAGEKIPAPVSGNLPPPPRNPFASAEKPSGPAAPVGRDEKIPCQQGIRLMCYRPSHSPTQGREIRAAFLIEIAARPDME
jgi:hypothetical protein